MSDLLLLLVQYGSYISIIKFALFVALFFAWLPLVGWVAKDATIAGTKETFWTGIVFAAGAIAAIAWLLVPIFLVGMLLFLIAAAVPVIIYTKHRDSKVPDQQRILTSQFFKTLFSKKEKKGAAAATIDEITFVTAHNSIVPAPDSGTAEASSYKIAYDIFTDCIWRRASDVILVPAPPNYNVVYYIDGAAQKQPTLTRQQVEQFIGFAKRLAGLDANEKRKPQRGRFRVRKNEQNTEWEVITAGSTAGEQLRLKQVMQQQLSKLPDIGLTADQLEQLGKVRELKQGLFIISGLKKAGITTTFYSLLKNHDPYLNTIVTLERQPSEDLPSVTQNVFALSDSSTTTYAKKLQALLKLRCDVIGVADCDNSETAKVACAAAAQGRLVYVILEAENVIKALGKWVKLVGDKNAAVENLAGITNQRLLRKLCDQCKEAYEPNKELLRKFNLPADKVKVLYRAGKPKTDKRGRAVICQVCQGTGFVGRIPIFEIITINEELRNFIKQSRSLSEIGTEFRRAKMRYLQEQGLKKVIAGATAITEIVRVLSVPEAAPRKTPEDT
jgi:type II secretory ATPase GspE/PulE/Tfp pilus assembly ATPase PilB-like protein